MNATVSQRLKSYLEARYNSIRKAAGVMDIPYQNLNRALQEDKMVPNATMLVQIIDFLQDLDVNWLMRGKEHDLTEEVKRLNKIIDEKDAEIADIKDLFLSEESGAVRQEIREMKKMINQIMDQL